MTIESTITSSSGFTVMEVVAAGFESQARQPRCRMRAIVDRTHK